MTESTDEEDKLELSSFLDEEKTEFQRMLTSIKDITYLLNVVPAKEQTLSVFIKGIECYF